MNSKLYNQQEKKLVKPSIMMNIVEWNDIFSLLQDVVLKSHSRYKQGLEYFNSYIGMVKQRLMFISNFIKILNKYIPSKSSKSCKN